MGGFSDAEKEELGEIIKKLKTLDERSILSYWISAEIDEAEMYNRLANVAEEYSWDERIPQLFRTLAEESLNHAGILLEEYKRRYRGASLVEVDIPSLETDIGLNSLEEHLRNGNIEEVLEVLMESEKMARDVYAYLSRNSTGSTGELFGNLAKIEDGHFRRLLHLRDSLKKMG
ncbi:ferritin-like domain-containing protein [Thermococcus aciditolerans]|uniref:Rubrerythrin n=1 Tax=Thermococcus aciditolerans TaxID=2598455 RepID=A0A5C0SK70_9EURY|nr:ferritin family protein [Thermococcus aciditolerans]QEK14422.1 rubrerythrin [Thermococcus aciditolerans]